jgi:UDP-N-acetylglucosamine 4-epimerase
MTAYDRLRQQLAGTRHRWLVTGAAGFIGSNLVETLLRANQEVVGLDNFSTGHRSNLRLVQESVSSAVWSGFRLIEGDIRRPQDCREAVEGADYVLHQAALGSVPRSIADPLATHESNATGFVNMLVACRDAHVKRVVYASSSSVYGDHPALPKVEDVVGKPLSPYAVTKASNEDYAGAFARCYAMECIGLRYFNVFGPRQDPDGAYAAVIPRWISALIANRPVKIFGDGQTSRDFCYVDNAVQVNLLAAASAGPEAVNQVYNVAVGGRTSLNELFEMSRDLLVERFPHLRGVVPEHGDFRPGDVRHSQADIAKAVRLLGYAPTHRIEDGLREAMQWYVTRLSPGAQVQSA